MKITVNILLVAFILTVLLVVIAHGMNTPHCVLVNPPATQDTAFQVGLKTILAADLNIQAQRDRIEFYTKAHQYTWGPKEMNEYQVMRLDLGSLERIRLTEIAQYNSLAEGPDTKWERAVCLPVSVDANEDIAQEIGILNSYCI